MRKIIMFDEEVSDDVVVMPEAGQIRTRRTIVVDSIQTSDAVDIEVANLDVAIAKIQQAKADAIAKREQIKPIANSV